MRSVRAMLIVAGACAGVMSGCKVGPDYAPPTVNAPQSFTHVGSEGYARVSEVSGPGAPEAAWWTTLRDPQLNSLIERAVSQSLDLRLAELRIVEARMERGVVASEAGPTIGANSSFNRQRQSERVQNFPGSGQMRNLWQAGFDASWELDVWGRVASGVEAAEAEIDAADESRRDVVVMLLSEVARNYVELRGFQRRLEIAAKNIKLQEEAVQLTQARFDSGLTSEVDVAQAKAVLATTRSTVPTLDAGVKRSMHRLGVLLGQQPTALLEELAPVAPIPAPPTGVVVGLPSELLKRRPDVRRAEREVAAATARVGVATADLFPRFSLSGAFGLQSNRVQSIDEPGARFWSFGPAVRWPIFQSGRVRANIAVQNTRVEQSLVRFEQAVLTSFEDVENALTAYTREQARRAALEQAVGANARALELSRQLYSNGLSDFLRVLDSQRALFSSEDQLVESERTVATNLVALYKALGGGWEATETHDAGAPGPAGEAVPAPTK